MLENTIRSARINGIIWADDVVLLNTMNNRLRTMKTEYVNKNHITEDGMPRKISELTSGGKHFFVTYCAGKKKIKSSTLDGLYDKLYVFYSNDDKNYYSFGNMFQLALEQKKLSKGLTGDILTDDASKHNTIYKIERDYKRYIDGNFAKQDIRDLTPLIIKEYTFSKLNQINADLGHKISQKAFSSYKGILNLTFGYADERNICTNFIDNKSKFKNRDFANLYDSSKKPVEEKVFSIEQICEMTEEIESRFKNTIKYGTCYTDGYMFKFSKLTGLRVAELCALLKSDLNFDNDFIHVHAQQLKKSGTQIYEYKPYTKDEKGNSKGGRLVPLLPEAKALILELFEKQQIVGIDSEYVFANPDGSWIKSDTHYQKFLQRLSKKFGYPIHNNHAIRMYFNSYVLIPAGIDVVTRAKILGHSVEVNLRNYTFEDRKYCDNAYKSLCTLFEEQGTTGGLPKTSNEKP